MFVVLQLGLALIVAVVVLIAVRCGWIGDVVGLATPVAVAASVVLSIVALVWSPRWSVVPLALLAVSTFVVVAPRVPRRTAQPGGGVRLVSTNLLYHAEDPAGGVASALGRRPDVLVVSELTEVTDRLLSSEFPHRVATEVVIGGVPFGQGVYSHLPLTELDAPTATEQMVKVRVGGATPFVLYAVHLPRPTFESPPPLGLTDFADHHRRVLALVAATRADTEPVVITGDLNLSDRTSGYRRLAAGRLDVGRTRWARSTFVASLRWSLALLRIDHMFAPGDWCASAGREFDIAGSDHRGLVADLGPCRSPTGTAPSR